MLRYRHAEDREVRQYLLEEFNDMQKFDDCVLMPPRGMVIKIEEPLQTCHPSSGDGLDQDNCIPPGIYEMGEMSGGHTSHWGYLKGLHGSHDVRFCAGYCENYPQFPGSMIDWRGAKKFDPPTQ